MDVGALAVKHDAASAAIVRAAIADDLARHAVPDDAIGDVLLVASELVGNAVLHTSGEIGDGLDVHWDVFDDHVFVEVHDPSSDLPQQRVAADSDFGGRGLAIVAAISSDWGVRSTRTGKRVWARVPVTPAA
ncbi:ATP-binding protein [uncultured Jatrophihabitans sp.]|uniref:ATP-binding protein n=1 Tax=uncultured Jatrophihabitans sp. TaxID=1610747 RepID=UPI0035C9FFD9